MHLWHVHADLELIKKKKATSSHRVALGQVLRLSEPQSPPRKMGIRGSWLTGSLRRSREPTHRRQLARRPAQGPCSGDAASRSSNVSSLLSMEPPGCSHLSLRPGEHPDKAKYGTGRSQSHVQKQSACNVLALSVKSTAVSVRRYPWRALPSTRHPQNRGTCPRLRCTVEHRAGARATTRGQARAPGPGVLFGS